jgi:hypothetical protein
MKLLHDFFKQREQSFLRRCNTLEGIFDFRGGNFPGTFEDFTIVGMNQQVNFVNLPVQFGSRMAFPDCPP